MEILLRVSLNYSSSMEERKTGGGVGGYLRIEHKAPQDTEAVCIPQMLLPDAVCVFGFVLRKGCTFYEIVNHEAAQHHFIIIYYFYQHSIFLSSSLKNTSKGQT